MNKFINWLILSSNDSEKISLTIKGLSGVLITGFTVIAGFAHVQTNSEDLTHVIDAAIALIQVLSLAVSTSVAFYGAVRKVVTTFKGENAVLNNPLI